MDHTPQSERLEYHGLDRASGLTGHQALRKHELTKKMIAEGIARNNTSIEAIGDRLLAQQRALEEKLFTQQRALEDKLLAQQRALEEKLFTQQHAFESSLGAWQRALEKRLFTQQHAFESSLGAWQRALESTIDTQISALVTKQNDLEKSMGSQTRMFRWLIGTLVIVGTLILGVFTLVADLPLRGL